MIDVRPELMLSGENGPERVVPLMSARTAELLRQPELAMIGHYTADNDEEVVLPLSDPDSIRQLLVPGYGRAYIEEQRRGHKHPWSIELDPYSGLMLGGFSRTRLGARYAAWRRRRLLTAKDHR